MFYHGGLGAASIPTLLYSYLLAWWVCSGLFLGLLGSGRQLNIIGLHSLWSWRVKLLCTPRLWSVLKVHWQWYPASHLTSMEADTRSEPQTLMISMCPQAQHLLDIGKTEKLALRVERKWNVTTSQNLFYMMLLKTYTKVISQKELWFGLISLNINYQHNQVLPYKSWSSIRQI